MRRVLFVTVGTSAITAEDLWKNVPNGAELQRRVGKFLKTQKEEEREDQSEGLKRGLSKAHAAFWGDRRRSALKPLDYRHTSAELVTTFGLLGSGQPEFEDFPQRDGDGIVLLASNTAAGKLAASVNWHVLHGSFAKDCDCGGIETQCTRVRVEIVPGLDPERQFGKLKEGLAERVAPYKGAQAAFNVTGGFKGAIPYLTWLAFKEFPGAPMFYQHETMTSAWRIMLEAGRPEPGAAVEVQLGCPDIELPPELS